MQSAPLVSVIIPSYNAARYAVEAVASVLAQTYQRREIIFINDGSTDDTEKVLAPYVGKIRYVRQSNQGLSATRNRGIAMACGELLAFLDADDVWRPEKLARQVHCLTDNPRIGLVHTNYLKLFDDTGICTARQAHDIKDGSCYTALILKNIVQVSSVLLRRACLETVGGFDEAIPHHTCEDYDLWLRFARHFEFAYLPDPLMLYRRHAGNMSNDTRAMTSDELYVVEKALKADPSLAARAGKRAVRDRLADLSFTVGYHDFDEGRLREAGPYLRHTLRFRHHPYIFMLWASTFLPLNVVTRLRRFKQFLAGADRPASPPHAVTGLEHERLMCSHGGSGRTAGAVDAPDPCPPAGDVEENEAVKHR